MRSPESGAQATFEVLFTGSFLPLHGTDVIVEAARIVAGRDPSVRFTLIGSGQTREAAGRLAEGYGLRNVEFAGWRSLGDLPSRIAAADVSLGIFGRTEKARRVVPHKLVQALGMGKAVVTARTPAAEEFFVHREHVIFCDEPLAESLAAAVLELKADAALRERIARKGQALAAERFSARAIAARLVEIVEKRFGKSRHPERSERDPVRPPTSRTRSLVRLRMTRGRRLHRHLALARWLAMTTCALRSLTTTTCAPSRLPPIRAKSRSPTPRPRS